MSHDDLASALDVALADEDAQRRRIHLAIVLAAGLSRFGDLLHVGGWIFGSDRVQGTSPFGNGSDETVGLAVVAQTGGQLVAGSVALLEVDNRYAAMALIRQLVEVEYLAWTFAHEVREADAWLRSTRADRRQKWGPRNLREASDGRFRNRDYSDHCEMGGHPTPTGGSLLPNHSPRLAVGVVWHELLSHGVDLWDYLMAAAGRLRQGAVIERVDGIDRLRAAVAEWRATDPVLPLAGLLRE